MAPTSIITACWDDIRLFHSLAGGTVDYCRAHLAYVPGALDCYQFPEQVCSVLTPATGEWAHVRSPGPGVVFPCPDPPMPPVCPRLTWR